jgi:hypothetical protein
MQLPEIIRPVGKSEPNLEHVANTGGVNLQVSEDQRDFVSRLKSTYGGFTLLGGFALFRPAIHPELLVRWRTCI